MNNRETDEAVDQYHLFIALRRKKENRDMKEICFRQIIKDESLDLQLIKDKIKGVKGIWRIYKTVNPRKVVPARKLLMKRLIDEPERFEYRIDSLWKNCLLQKECKGERNLLIDIDSETIPKKIKDMFDNELKGAELIQTPNGWHIICEHLDTRLLQRMDNVEVKRDDIKFVELIEND